MDPGSLLLIAVTLGLLFMITSRGRRQQREAQLMQSRLEPGVEVVTTSGLYATVVELDDAVAVLETGPGQYVRWDRRAVGRVVTPVSADDGDGGASTADEPTVVEPTGVEPTVVQPTAVERAAARPPAGPAAAPPAPAGGGSTAADIRD